MKMNFQKIKQDLLKKVFQERRFRPSIRAKQLLLLGGGAAALLLGGGIYLSSASDAPPPVQETKPVAKQVSKMTTPLKTVDERDIWVNRIEKKTEAVREESQALRQENELLEKRLDVIETLFKGNSHLPNQPVIQPPVESAPQPMPPVKQSQPQFPAPGSDIDGEPGEAGQKTFSAKGGKLKKRGSKIAHLKGTVSSISYKTKDLYMPAGTYSKAVLLSGMAASTATNAQGNPQPMMMRLVDDGNLPRGFKGRVKDAVLIGSCYGDISSERAYCRLETLSWVEEHGTTVEKKVEGWVFGEDGRAGLRGEVVDRSGDIARESFGAGLLSAAANFFKMESSRGVYPVSPFGQTNPMSNKEALQGAGASGVGSALDRLADFSIKRAEQMQPVILIASGRVVDIAFKQGVSLMAESEEDLKVVGRQTQEEGEE